METEQINRPWPEQKELDLLVRNGFAEIDEQATARWHDIDQRRMYRWTPAGRDACFRSRYSTPMSWAVEMRRGARHCIGCGRDTYRLKVFQRYTDRKDKRTICLSCGAQGMTLDNAMVGPNR